MGKYDHAPAFRPQQKEGVNRQLVLNALKAWKQPRVDVRDPQAIADRIEEYLTHCAENDVVPSVGGCANWLGVSINVLRNWYEGKRGSPEHQQVATMFYAVMQDIWAQDMHDGNINPVSGIFIGKAFYGYKDTQEIVVQQNNNQDALSTVDLIAESKRLPGAERLLSADDKPTIEIEATVIEPKKESKRGRRKAAQPDKPTNES